MQRSPEGSIPHEPEPSQPPVTRRRSSRSSIAERLRWSYLISSTLPLLLVGAVLLNIGASAQQANVYSDQKNLATRISRSIAGYFERMVRQVDSYAAVVRPGTTAPSAWEQKALDLVSAGYPELVGLTVVDASGRELLRVANLQLVPADQLGDRTGDEVIRQVLRENKRVVSSITLDRDGSRHFMLTQPLPNDAGATIGALEVELSADPILQELRVTTTGSNSLAYLVTPEGRAVIEDGTSNPSPTSEVRTLLNSSAGVAQYNGARGEYVIGAVSPVILHQDEAVGWLVVTEQPSSVAFSSVYGQVVVLALLVLLVGALALLWAFRSAQTFLRPLEALRSGALALGDGHLDHRIPVVNDDELGEVANAFNQMAEHLQQSQAEVERQNEHLRRGLALARDIQVGLLPDRAPWSGEAFDVYARSIPAYEVGGDFYTYLALPESRAAIAIGDISGKGVGAALLMALTSSAVESQGRQIDSPAKVLSALNQLLAPRLKANHMNAALLFLVFDPEASSVTIANAGMIAPVLISHRGNRFIDVGGLPVGSFAGAQYQEEVVRLDPDDMLLLVSDGVVEAHNPQGELFGFERLEETVGLAHPAASVRSLVEQVLDEVHQFMGDAEQHDDITIVAIRMATIAKPVDKDEEQTLQYASV